MVRFTGDETRESCDLRVEDPKVADAYLGPGTRCEGTKGGTPPPVELAELGLDAFEWRRKVSIKQRRNWNVAHAVAAAAVCRRAHSLRPHRPKRKRCAGVTEKAE